MAERQLRGDAAGRPNNAAPRRAAYRSARPKTEEATFIILHVEVHNEIISAANIPPLHSAQGLVCFLPTLCGYRTAAPNGGGIRDMLATLSGWEKARRFVFQLQGRKHKKRCGGRAQRMLFASRLVWRGAGGDLIDMQVRAYIPPALILAEVGCRGQRVKLKRVY